MIDSHLHPENWGIKPTLFQIGNFEVHSYSFFIVLALVVGVLIYFHEARKNKTLSENTFYIFIAALVGGVLGAKIPIWILNYKLIISSFPNLSILLSGRTITGGLIGGTLGVLFIKKILKIKGKRGNLFAPAIAIGVAIGRIGCFLRGCCYGKETILPWGVNFGDGILRHPTQIYESIFMFGMFFYIIYRKNKNPKPGELFKILMIAYFTFRFFIEFIRVEQVIFLGLTLFQLISIAAVIYFSRESLKSFINNKIFNKR